MTRLHDLYDQHGQSPWLDNLKRHYLVSGELQRLVDAGIRGVTSNPTIFQKAIAGSADYDDQFRELLAQHTVEDAYWGMVVKDVGDALAVLRPAYDSSGGLDGFVSVEVAPSLAGDTDGTIKAARFLHDKIAEPNLYVKIPATPEGVPAIRQMIAEGRSINITLIFSLTRYDEVIEAYLSGLEACEGDLSQVHWLREQADRPNVFVKIPATAEGLPAIEDCTADGISVNNTLIFSLDRHREVAEAYVRGLERLLENGGDPSKVASVASFFVSRVDTEADKRLLDGHALRGRVAVANAKLAYQRFLERFTGDRWEALAARTPGPRWGTWSGTSGRRPPLRPARPRARSRASRVSGGSRRRTARSCRRPRARWWR